jgi:hypothetical protein
MPSGWGSSPASQETAPTAIFSTSLFPIPRDGSVAASSFVSGMDSENSSGERLPQMPAQESDGRVRCEICQQRLLIADDKSWKYDTHWEGTDGYIN